MFMRRIVAGLAAVSLLAMPLATSPTYAAGSVENLPVIGGSSYCASTVSGVTLPTGQGPYGVSPGSTQGTGQGICGQTVPAGPAALSGEELIKVDVNNGNGGAPQQTALIASSSLGTFGANVNRIIGGDFTTNLWQRGTTPLSGASPATYQMAADRWFAISASNVMTVSKQTPGASAADYIGSTGILSWMRVARPSGTPSGSSCVGQILDQKASSALIGNNGVLSFWGYAPTTFSATNQSVAVSIAYYTAGDSATPGTNTATFALSASGQASGITGYTAATAGVGPNTTGVLASGVETINFTATPTRYTVYAPIPAANTGGTQVIGVGVSFCATPTATTTVTTDYFELAGVQLQAQPSTVTTAFPAGVISPTAFQLRFPSEEARLELPYSYVLTDGAAAQRYGVGQALTTGTANVFTQFPVPMREAPTLTVGTTISFGVTQAAGTAQACGTSIAAVASSLTTLGAELLCTTGQTNLTAGNATQFTGAATGGLLTFLAEP